MDPVEVVRQFLERIAVEQQRESLADLEERAARIRAMSPVEYVRQVGLTNVCPDACPPEVVAYLGVGEEQHFRVTADAGNEGLKLEVSQGQREWDRVVDPWGDSR